MQQQQQSTSLDLCQHQCPDRAWSSHPVSRHARPSDPRSRHAWPSHPVSRTDPASLHARRRERNSLHDFEGDIEALYDSEPETYQATPVFTAQDTLAANPFGSPQHAGKTPLADMATGTASSLSTGKALSPLKRRRAIRRKSNRLLASSSSTSKSSSMPDLAIVSAAASGAQATGRSESPLVMSGSPRTEPRKLRGKVRTP